MFDQILCTLTDSDPRRCQRKSAVQQQQNNLRFFNCWFHVLFTDTNSKLNSTPLQRVSLHAFSHDCTLILLPPRANQFFMMVNARVLFKAGFAEIVSVIILNLNFLSRKTWKTPFCLQRDFTNLTNQRHHYESFQGHQSTLFEYIQRMNSNMQSINYFNLRLVSEYEQL